MSARHPRHSIERRLGRRRSGGRNARVGGLALLLTLTSAYGLILGQSARSAAATSPAFVQQVSGHSGSVSSLALTPGASLGAGNRLVVEVGVWGSANATAKSVTDTAGDSFAELTHFSAADGTEMSVWSAPITAGAGTKSTITVTPSAKADVGATALEYSGLSTTAGTAAVDQMAHATGQTAATAATVASGPTPAATAGNELALGFYVDSGFGDTLSAGSGFTARVNVSPVGDMELFAEDQPVASGATPNASVKTGTHTYWDMATIVFKSG